MGKLGLALKLSDELGTSVSKASKFIDDVGITKAQNALDDVASAGSKTLSSGWWKAGAATGVVGGGALAWRQQDIQQAKQIANQRQSQQQALAEIMNSDLSPKAKQALVEQLLNAQDKSNDGGGGSGPFADLLPDMGGVQTTIALVVVLALLIQFGGGE